MQRGIVIGVFLVNLRDVEHARHLALLGTLPRLLGADAGAGLAGRDNQGGLCHAHCLVDFVFKIKETRCIQQIDLAVVPYDRRNGGRDRELTLDLFGIEIAYGIAFGHLADAVNHARGEQQALDERGLAVASVAHNAYVADSVYRKCRHNYTHSCLFVLSACAHWSRLLLVRNYKPYLSGLQTIFYAVCTFSVG